MNSMDRARLTIAHARKHEVQWAAYLALPLYERAAIQDALETAYQQHGVQAARDMMQALGVPMPPIELCDPVEELEAKRSAGIHDGWLRGTGSQLGLSDAETNRITLMSMIDRTDGR